MFYSVNSETMHMKLNDSTVISNTTLQLI